MDEEFIRNRITQLRTEKGISEYRMSLDLGHSKNYIRNITSGNAMPSVSELIYICKYFNISLKAFFDDEIKNPLLLQEAMDYLSRFEENELISLINLFKMIDDLHQQKK